MHSDRAQHLSGRYLTSICYLQDWMLAHAAAGNVTHAVRLLEAETPFMQSSGAKRIRRLAATGMAGEELRRENAPAKLLGLLHAGADPGQLAILPWRPLTGMQE